MQDLHAGTIGGHLEDNNNSKAVLLARWSQTGAILRNICHSTWKMIHKVIKHRFKPSWLFI